VCLIEFISACSIIVPLIIGLLYFQRLKLDMKFLVVFFFLIILIEVTNIILAYNCISNIWLLHIYTPLEYGFLVLIFSFWQKETALRKVLLISIPFFVLFSISIKMTLEDLNHFDNYTATFESIILVGISTYTLFNVSRKNRGALYSKPCFWVGIAVLIYFSGNLLAFALSKAIVTWTWHSILNIIANLCFAGGFLCFHQRQNYGGALQQAR
jgi:hypothetical protein